MTNDFELEPEEGAAYLKSGDSVAVIHLKYNSPYPSEITYKSDKNFDVRIKVLIEKSMKKFGYHASGERFENMIDEIGEIAEGCLFESRTSTSQPSQQGKEDEFLIKHMKVIREKILDSLIHVHMETMSELEKASVKYFIETGKVNGSFRNNLIEMMNLFAKNWNNPKYFPDNLNPTNHE